MPKWDDQRNKVKDIFDCIRNYGLTGLVFYIGLYTFKIDSEMADFSYFRAVFGTLTMIFACYLFWLNYGFFNKIVRDEYFAGNVGSFFYYVVPFCIAFLGVALLFNTALAIEHDNGKSIGKTTLSEMFESNSEKSGGSP